MKKIISVLLVLALAVALAACGNTDTNDTENPTNTTESTSDTTSTTETTESEEEKALRETQARYEKVKEYLAKYLENARITAVDISDEAIEVATLNAKENKVSDRVNVVKANALKKTASNRKRSSISLAERVASPCRLPDAATL